MHSFLLCTILHNVNTHVYYANAHQSTAPMHASLLYQSTPACYINAHLLHMTVTLWI